MMSVFLQQSRWRWALRTWRERMSWFRRGSEAEDKIVAQAADTVLEGLSDADLVSKVEDERGKNLRDQVTVAEALDMHEEAKLRRWGWGRN